MSTAQQNTVDEFRPEDFLSSLFRVTKAVLVSPRPFFEGMKSQGGLRNPLIFLASCVLIHALLVGFVLKSQALIAPNLIYGLVMPFITAGFLFFIIAWLFKVSGTYEMAFRVNAYAAAIALLSWIPTVGLVLEFYRIYLIVVGLSCTFSIKTSRALLATVMTMFIYMLLGTAIFHMTAGQWPSAAP